MNNDFYNAMLSDFVKHGADTSLCDKIREIIDAELIAMEESKNEVENMEKIRKMNRKCYETNSMPYYHNKIRQRRTKTMPPIKEIKKAPEKHDSITFNIIDGHYCYDENNEQKLSDINSIIEELEKSPDILITKLYSLKAETICEIDKLEDELYNG